MRRLLLLVSAVVLVDTMFFAAIVPLLPSYRDELGLSKSAAGILSAAYAGGTLVGSIPAGWLASRFGVRQTTLLGLGLLSGSSLAFAFANDIVLLDAARFVQGIGGACSWAGGLAWLIQASPRERRGELIGAALGAAIAGVVLGPALGGAADALGPEPVFSSVSVLGAGLAAWAFLTPAPPRAAAQGLGALGAAVRNPAVLGAIWLVALPALLFGAFDVLAPLRLDELGASGLAVGGLFLAAGCAEGAVSPLLGRASDRVGRMLPIRAGLTASVVLALLLPLPEAAALLGAMVVLAGPVFGAAFAPAMALLSDTAEGAGLEQGYAFALVNLAWALGQVGGGAGGGALADATSDAVPYTLVASLSLVTVVGVSRRQPAMES